VFPPLRIIARRLAVAALLALPSACDRGAARVPPGSAALDDFGDTVAVLPAPPARIVSLSPSTTELLFAIGAGDRVVGRSTYDSWPPAALARTDLGPGLRPNVEAVLGVRPDLVIVYASEDNRDAVRRLRAAGVNTVAYRLDRIADFERVTLSLGAITGDSIAARRTVDTVRATLDRVRAATSGLRHPTVFWRLWESPLLSVGGGSFLNDLLEIAGARNVYAELPQPSPAVTLEDLVGRDPDLLLTGPTTRERVLREPRWQSLRAVREGRLLVFDTAIVNGPSARVGESAVRLARLIHPGVLP
jgi:iron complex transport system substrate-binding protein